MSMVIYCFLNVFRFIIAYFMLDYQRFFKETRRRHDGTVTVLTMETP